MFKSRGKSALTAIGATGVLACHTFTFADSKIHAPYFKVGTTMNPKFDKRDKGGEDGFVVGSNQRMIMVADGVGGWTSRGVDPGKYAKFLCKQAGKLFDEKPDLSLKQILTEADEINPNT